MVNWISGTFIFAKIWKLFLFLLLCFGSLLWVIAIIAVIWGIADGLIPAIRKKEYKKAAHIGVILAATLAVIFLAVDKEEVYLFGFIIPILLLRVYIKKYIRLHSFDSNIFLN